MIALITAIICATVLACFVVHERTVVALHRLTRETLDAAERANRATTELGGTVMRAEAAREERLATLERDVMQMQKRETQRAMR
jgi:Na+/phosphate symporter